MEQRKMTEQEMLEYIKLRIKQQKNDLLTQSDWVMIPDVKESISVKVFQEIADWRKKIRKADDVADLSIWTDAMRKKGIMFSIFDVADLSDEACKLLKITKSLYR